MIQIPLEIGDTILAGRFKNKKITVKEISYDEYGSPTVNGRSILKIRIPKLYQTQENNMKLKEENLDNEVISGLNHYINLYANANFPGAKLNAELGRNILKAYKSGRSIDELIKAVETDMNRPGPKQAYEDYLRALKGKYRKRGQYENKIKESTNLFSKQTNVKIKQENKRWHIYLETVDGDECLTPVGYETKEQAEHAAMMKGYNFKGNSYSEDYEGLEVEKPTKRESTKGTDKPEEMKLDKEKEIKLESLIRRAIRETTNREEYLRAIKSIMNAFKSGIIDKYSYSEIQNDIHNMERSVDEKNYLQMLNKTLQDYGYKLHKKDNKWEVLSEISRKKVKLKENVDKQKIRKQIEDYIEKTWSKKPHKGQIRFRGDLLVIDNVENEFGDWTSSIASAATGKKWDHVSASIAKLKESFKLKEELSQSELEQKARRFAELAQKMKAMESELKQMEMEYTSLDQELTPLVEQVGKTKDTFIRAGKLLIKIERAGYEKKNASYKTGFEYLYNKVNATMKDLAEEALKMTQTVSYVKSKISVVQGESNLKEENWFQKIKNFLGSKIKKLFGLNNQANQLLTQLESKI